MATYTAISTAMMDFEITAAGRATVPPEISVGRSDQSRDRAEEAEQADRYRNVHRHLAPLLVTGHGAENNQQQAERRRNQRGRADPVSSEIAAQAQHDENNSESDGGGCQV